MTHEYMSISPSTTSALGSPFSTPSTRELKSDERGIYLIQLLLRCAEQVSANSFDQTNQCLEHISMLASPTGDTVQRIASCFTHALALRVLSSWRGFYIVLNPPPPTPAESLAARRHFFDLCPFLRLSYMISNQAIMETMEGEKMIHIIDLSFSDPAQWVPLLHLLRDRKEGPPHLRITGINEHKQLLDHTAVLLSEEAERLDIPFQFNQVVSRLDNLDPNLVRIKTGEALAISSVLQLHCLLASDDDAAAARKGTPFLTSRNSCSIAQFHRIVQMSQGTLGELLEKDILLNGYSMSPDSASSSPFGLPPAPKMERFLSWLCGLSPKVMVVTEQESNHNGFSMNERFMESLNYYAALFDCLESTMARPSAERMKVEKLVWGEEIRNIVACEGVERRERHEKLEKWVHRMEMAGFGSVPLGYYTLLQARRLLQGFGCEGYKIREENGFLHLCWQDRSLFSVSAWRRRRFD
ncbi:scarecrow-like protein 3 [Dioscorea cayenensis subsp. rotundata]|uniref:Scarecrow-like protein 3 n=1 Tax=Dioscorea cayennensis subsp. rotundata TaxID=55577 RepID=A0AB40BNM6_DIOCR|nr:scarecrow-like protein 3 [Dioscorea cayenensis subsp. rotundata]